MTQVFPRGRRPVGLALLAFTCLTPLTPFVARAQDEAATPPVVEAVAASEPVDSVAPVLDQPLNLVVDAVDASGASVLYAVPGAFDAVDGPVAVACDWPSGSVFPIGTTLVTCGAQDLTGNYAAVQFTVTVNALPLPTPEPTATLAPTVAPEPTATPTTPPAPTATPVPPEPTQPAPTATTEPIATAAPNTAAPTQAIEEPVAVEETTPEATPVMPPLSLPWPPPGDFTIVTDGGPVGVLASIWGNDEYPITQEFGHTEFSLSQPSMYQYGLDYGLDGYEHPGLDIGMPAGTWLYAPVEGTVKIAGGVPYFTFYGNGQLGVGELLIRTDAGDEVVLGHMGAIAVQAGQRVSVGQFVGLSGGDNGDHLHLETRDLQSTGGFLIVDPRDSFLIDALTPDKLLPEDSLTKEA